MLNNVNLIGRLVRDPELRKTNTGVAVVNFTMAVQREGKNAETDFIDCQAWKEQAENIAKYCKKGDLVAVTGRLQLRKYQSKDGATQKTAEVVLSYWSILSSRKKEEPKQYNHEVAEVDNYNTNFNNFTTFSGISEDDIQF